jgi:hypothetical protein
MYQGTLVSQGMRRGTQHVVSNLGDCAQRVWLKLRAGWTGEAHPYLPEPSSAVPQCRTEILQS